MLGNTGKSLEEAAECELDWPWGDDGAPGLCRHVGSGSGGYADQIFLYAAEQLFGQSDAPLVYKNLR
jgi:hypothetical protein